MNRLRILLMAAAIASIASGCAHTDIIAAPEAPLGRVVVYRNGVAYFERHARVDGSLSLEVPRGRVDDFLKSLTVVDASDGTPLAISYRTPRESAGSVVTMEIELPPGPRDVRITYVTESPAWKPSYRVVLGEDDEATLQSWAVVDNVSGESWDKVRVGVGSTSALSFRYDLHSVRMVQRETIDHGDRLAAAPPTGGSAYAVGGEKQRVLANLSVEELDQVAMAHRDFTQSVEVSATAARDSAGLSLAGTTGAEAKYTLDTESIAVTAGKTRRGRKSKRRRKKRRKDEGVPPGVSGGVVGGTLGGRVAPEPSPPAAPLDRLAQQLSTSSGRIRIEGNAMRSEVGDTDSGLRRANTLREALVARGVSSDRIDVVDGGTVVDDPAQAVQVVAIEEPPAASQAVSESNDDGGPQGSAHFVAEDPITLQAGHSAMVTLLNEATQAKQVYVYDPTSDRGSSKFAFNAVRLRNPSDHTLDAGPVTVYADGQFLGEGIADPIPPKATALVPYALDRTLRVEPRTKTREQIQRLLTVQRGIATTQTQRIRETVLAVDNRGTDDTVVYVRHAVPSGWTLLDPPDSLEHYGDDVLVPVRVKAGERATVTLAESMPINTSIDLRASAGLRAVQVYLKAGEVPPALAEQLESVLATHARLHDLDDALITQREQLAVLRARVQELNVQLVSLRKVGKAQSLSSHLAKRMRALSDDLDAATLEVTELQNNQLTARIELSNQVADLTLAPPKGSSIAGDAAP